MSADKRSTPHRDGGTGQVAISARAEATNSAECPGVDTQDLEPVPAPKRSSREVDFARRALVQAGWAVPAILAIGLPCDAKAQYEPLEHHLDGVSNPHNDSIFFPDTLPEHDDSFPDTHEDECLAIPSPGTTPGCPRP